MAEDNINIKDLDFRLDPQKYTTPEDSDFYLGAVDDTYLKILDKMINKDTAEGRNAAFYTESPPFSELGAYDEGYFIKANLSSLTEEDFKNGIVDANNLLVPIYTIQGGNKNEAILAIKQDLSNQAKLHPSYEFSSQNFFVSLIGINAPSPPKMAVEQHLKKSEFEFKEISLEDAKNDSENEYVFQYNDIESDASICRFIKVGDVWHQISDENYIEDSDNIVKMSWCVESGERNNSLSEKLMEIINESGDEVWFALDKNNCSSDNTKSHYANLNEYDSTLKTLQKLNRYSRLDRDGYHLMETDLIGRYAGIAYIKKDGKWINLTKALLTTSDNAYCDTSYNGSLKDKIRPKSYDQDQVEFADAYFNLISELDDRSDIQHNIFGMDFSNNDLNEWTVTLGDVTLFIPPVNITFYSENASDELPLLRSSGRMRKQKRHTTRHLQLTMFFNEDKGINGYEYKAKTSNNNEEIAYYINGLRAIVSQFKFIPFIPIENKYINEVLGISAVTVNNLTCQSVKGFPKLIQASLTVTEFNFEVYMPECIFNSQIGEDNDDKFVNYFSRSFNWKTARYYYQRALIAGNKLAEMNLPFNSSNYNKELLKRRTTLMPMKFKNPYINFYIASIDYLEEMLSQKLGAINGKREQQINFSDKEIELAKDISAVYDAVQSCMDDENFVKSMKEISSEVDTNLWINYETTLEDLKKVAEVVPKTAENSSTDKFSIKTVGTSNGINEKIINALSILKQKVFDVNQAYGKNIVESVPFLYAPKIKTEGSKITIGVSVTFNKELLNEDSGVEDLKNDVSKFIGADPTKMLEKNTLIIPFTINISDASEESTDTTDNKNVPLAYKVIKVSDSDFYLDTEEDDWRFLSYCKDISQMQKESSDGISTDVKRTSSVNLAQLDNLYYEKLDISSTLITNWSVSLSNHISTVNISDLSGSSPQYLGGEDLEISIEILTSDEDTVEKLSKLPKICAEFGRRYHLVLPASVIRIQAEFAQFFGVHEVLIKNVIVDTVQGQPGLKSVGITMVSNDRSLRNREALTRIEADNAGKLGKELGRTVAKSYLDINKCISKVELYPDLELPTLEELQKLGFDFVRYKFQDDRVYVDPDFYFVYLGILTSQALRELIINSTKNDVGTKATWKDATGAQVKVEMATRTGFNIVSNNDQAKIQLDNIHKAHEAAHTLTAHKLSQQSKDSIDDSAYDILEANRNIQEEFRGIETWEICEDIQSHFMEKNYRQEIYAYENYLNVKDIADSNSTTKNSTSSSDSAVTKTVLSSDVTTTKSTTSSDTVTSTASKTSTEIKATEGKWAYSQIENCLKVAGKKEPKKENSSSIDEDYGKIWKFLNEKSIEDIIKGNEGNKKSFTNSSGNYSTTKTQIEKGVDLFFLSGIKEYFDDLGIKYDDSDFQKITKEIIFAAACAATAEKEYSNKDKSENWYPANDYYGTIAGREQDAAARTLAHNIDEAVEQATEFGIFKIKQYTPDAFASITGEDSKNVWSDTVTLNTTHFLIDPYYRYADIEKIKAYKKGCIENPTYATVAYMRIMLYWLSKLYRNYDFPNISGDIMHSVSDSELQAIEKILNIGVGTNTDSVMKKNADFFKKRRYSFDAGKMWTAAVLASTDGNKIIRDRIERRDYRALNSYVEGVSNPASRINAFDSATLTVRKMILSLVGQKRIKNMSAEGVTQDNPGIAHERNLMEKKYIEQAEDPKTYCVHACHDMIVHDARGRMLRAFPTYYMAMIDEGREIGLWKLHDNFYNNMAIASMEVVKSRKLAADTAIIVMSNFYQQFSTEDEDYRKYEPADYREVFDSIFSPVDYGKNLEKKRLKPPKQSLIRLRPGARIHLRMGYGSNASMLPVVFNGTIAEVSALDTVEIVAQGDGIELLNPINDDIEAYEIINQDTVGKNWFINGGTPRQIMNAILTTHGGVLSNFSHFIDFDMLKNFFGRNPYGIYHFGNPDFTDIIGSGETTQNIFEAVSKPAWGTDENVSKMYADEEPPYLTFDAFQKTVWDCANICCSVSPDYVCAVAPFDYRSTLFIGHPRYYYAYGYDTKQVETTTTNVNLETETKTTESYTSGLDKTTTTYTYGINTSSESATLNYNGSSDVNVSTTTTDILVEKRKPFQQFHIYSSSTDIISNGIVASRSKMKTVAVGLYQTAWIFNIKNQKRVGPLFADIDIFPEDQKTMIVDTQLYGKGKPIIGYLGGNLLSNIFDNFYDDQGENSSHEKVAWRMTASALKNSVKDMYQGDMIVIGDPTVKPHDRLMITDQYSGICGQCTVKEVVMKMSVEEGFTTTISPDCINVVDDRFETVTNLWCGTIARHASSALLGGAALWAVSTYGVSGLANKIKNMILPNSSSFTGKTVEKIKSFLKNHEESIEKLTQKLTKNSKNITKGVKALSSLISLAVAGGGAVAGGAAVAAAAIEALPGIVIALAAWAVAETIGAFVSSFIERAAKNWQVLQIFPLKRYGITWTAGLTGSKGLVVGSPTYEQQGSLESVFSSLFKDSLGTDLENISEGAKKYYTGEDGGFKQVSIGILSLILGLVKTDEIENIAKRYDVSNNLVDDDGNSTIPIATHKEYLRELIGKNSAIAGDFRGMMIVPRADYSSANDISQSYKYFAMSTTEQCQNDPKFRNNNFISNDYRIKKYIENGFFKLVHETPGLNKGDMVDTFILTVDGEKHYVKAINYEDSKGNKVYDVPLLNKDAINILYEILRRTKNNMPSAKSSDKYESYDLNKSSFIALESALRIGDQESQAAAGFTFILHGVDQAAAPMYSAIKTMHDDIENAAKENSMFNESLFDSKDLGSNKVAIAVRMPKITREFLEKQKEELSN